MTNFDEVIDRGKQFGYVLFWGHAEKSGKVTKACLSQWYPCVFTDDTRQYHSAEQYMMSEKALLMKDFPVRDQILNTTDPKKIKSLGRSVRNFNQKLWDSNKSEIVIQGNFLKFSQNQNLCNFLIETGNCVLVEASPYDTIWGIGMSADDPDARNPQRWKGANLLGFALMKVRERLISR